jgi:hypothetical protein
LAEGTWINPVSITPPTPEEQGRRARIGRLKEVSAGTWRNPGLSPEAREINALPHKHSGALASAIHKLRHGKMSDLTEDEHTAWLEYRRELKKLKQKAP